jgi:hypothetical protein
MVRFVLLNIRLTPFAPSPPGGEGVGGEGVSENRKHGNICVISMIDYPDFSGL